VTYISHDLIKRELIFRDRNNMQDVIFTWLLLENGTYEPNTSTFFWNRQLLALPKIGQRARLSLTVFELQMCKNYVTHIVPVSAYFWSFSPGNKGTRAMEIITSKIKVILWRLEIEWNRCQNRPHTDDDFNTPCTRDISHTYALFRLVDPEWNRPPSPRTRFMACLCLDSCKYFWKKK